MKKFLTVFFLTSVVIAFAQNTSRIQLPNGWFLSPAGTSIQLGDLPLNIAVSPNKKILAVTNNGQSIQTIQLIDAAAHRLQSSIIIPKSWVGLAWSADSKTLYASGGNDNRIMKYSTVGNQLKASDSIMLGKPWPNRISPAGMAVNDAKNELYVVTKDNNTLYTIDLLTKKFYSTPLGAEAFTCILSVDKKRLYISLWGGGKLLVFDIASKKITGSVIVGDHPNDICQTENGKFIFVANANDNSVSVINTVQLNLVETLNAALYPDSKPGSTTNSVALSSDNKTLYIANADNNCLAVFDVSRPGFSQSKGFIPVGWYPTCVRIIDNTIFVTNGKGLQSMANPFGPNPNKTEAQLGFQKGDTSHHPRQYIGSLFTGMLSIILEPGDDQLALYSKMVYDNTPYNKSSEMVADGMSGNPVPMKIGDPSPIKYVFYIIKENRTYDQVLGDLPAGNGDSSLCLFGEKVTPNQHALAREFVLLDNFYVNAEVSADGHNWSMGAYANDYLEKTWPTSYGGRGGTYESEGNRPVANNKGGFIWDHCARAGVSYRSYGEFTDDYPPYFSVTKHTVLKNHYCKHYTNWNQQVRDTTRFGQWKKDFDSLLRINTVPRFNTIRFINDHTEGLSKGRPTPIAHCADNDLAVGMFVDYLSRSPIWKESVVFILEDDAQDGPDHVDAHRSTAYLAGGFVKRKFVDHTMYSTTSVLRTIELILGIPPMSQYDAAATSMFRSFSSTPDLNPYKTKPLESDINEKNIVENEWQRMSEKFDFSKEDRINDRAFTEVIWKAVKGENAVVPASKRAAFVKTGEDGDDK